MIITNTASGKSNIQQLVERTEITKKLSVKLSGNICTSGILKGLFVITLAIWPLLSLMSFCSFSDYVLMFIERTESATKLNCFNSVAKRDFCGGR